VRSPALAVLIAAATLGPATANAQEPPPAAAQAPQHAANGSGHDVTELSLEDMLNTPVTVATTEARPLREVPSVISVITRQEIQNSGARDLIDILRLVPGFEFDGDVSGSVNIGFRGNSLGTGKVLMMIDGIDVSEHLFATLLFGNHYPIENIERIEIIRGGGSVLYGGAAEFAVINLISRTGAEISGVGVSGIYGQEAHALDRADITLNYGQAFDNGLDLMFSGLIGEGRRSDRNYSDFYGSTVSFAQGNNNTLDPLYLNLGASFKGFKARILFDSFTDDTVDASGQNFLDANGNANPLQLRFTSLSGALEYEAHFGDRLTVSPKLTYWFQRPWQVSDITSPGFYDKDTTRVDGKITATLMIVKGLHVMAGFETYGEHAWMNHPELAGTAYQDYFPGQSTWATNRDVAGFAEVSWDSPWVNLTAGGRFENHSVAGNSFVPRLAATKVFGNFHAKLLYSQSFRAPSFEETALGDPNAPQGYEHVTLEEIEAGYQFTDNVFARVNLFNLIMTDTLVYQVNPATGNQGYINGAQSGSRGVEVELRVKASRGYGTLTYSFYTTGGINQVPSFEVPGQPDYLLAYPQHKVTLNASVNLPASFSINPSAMFYSTRYGYLTQDGTNTGVGVIGQEPPGLLLNLFLYYHPPMVKGLDVGVGVYNLLNDSYQFIQAYNAGHAPLPAPSRDFVLKASYNFGL
jgi:outer membrane receptor protein involved in Fe transport